MTARNGRPNATGRSSGKMGGRAGRLMKPPKGEPWIWLTREIIASEAWRSLGINARRFIDFLLIEHMAHAGTENGNLKAPFSQLIAFGMSRRDRIAEAIREAENYGLVDCHRGGMRVATTYTLTWLPLRDGTPATNRWRQNTRSVIEAKCRNLGAEGNPDKVPKGTQIRPIWGRKGTQMLGAEGNHPSISTGMAPPNDETAAARDAVEREAAELRETIADARDQGQALRLRYALRSRLHWLAELPGARAAHQADAVPDEWGEGGLGDRRRLRLVGP